MKTIPIEHGTKEWHERRLEGIGSSDIATIMGVNPYQTPYQLWQEKTGRIQSFQGNAATEHGKREEPKARNWLQGDYKPIFIEHPDHTFVYASLDAYSAEKKLIVEIKSPYGGTNRKIKSYEEIPIYWIYQVQWQHFIARQYIPEVGAKILIWIDNVASLYDISPDFDLQEKMMECANNFWTRHVIYDYSPEKSKSDTHFLDNQELNKYLEDYNAISEEEMNLKQQKDSLKSKILSFCDGNSSYKTPTNQIILTSPRVTYDYKSMIKDGLNIENYKKTSSQSSYSIKRIMTA